MLFLARGLGAFALTGLAALAARATGGRRLRAPGLGLTPLPSAWSIRLPSTSSSSDSNRFPVHDRLLGDRLRGHTLGCDRVHRSGDGLLGVGSVGVGIGVDQSVNRCLAVNGSGLGLRLEIRPGEHAHCALTIALDSHHAFLAGSPQQIDNRRKSVLALVEALDRGSQELLRLTHIHRPSRRRGGLCERLLHGADAVLHAHGRGWQRFFLVRVVNRHGLRRTRFGAPRGNVRLGSGGGRLDPFGCTDHDFDVGGAVLPRFDEHAPPGVLEDHRTRLGDLLHEVPEAARAVIAFRKRRIELEERALEQSKLRRDLALGQHLQRALDERQRLGDSRRRDRLAALGGPASTAREVLVGDELVAVLLHGRAGELPPTNDDDLAAVLLQLLDERNEIAVAADDDEGVDVIVGESHLQRVERHRDVGAVLVAARGEVALNHPDGMLREDAAVVAGALPVAVGDLGDDLAPLLDGFEDETDIELTADRALDSDLDVVEIDEHGDPCIRVSVGFMCLSADSARGPGG